MKTNGTCPCCFGSFVVKHSVMVLHGYKRPGVGYIIGNCPATRTFKPYEVSVEGTGFMRGLVAAELHRQQVWLKKLQNGSVTEFTVERERKGVDLMPYGQRKALKYEERYETVKLVKGDGQKRHSYDIQEWFDLVLDARISETNGKIRQVESDLKFLNEKIQSWKAVDLTKQNEDVAAAVEAEKAMLCPGSGTHDHDGSRMRFAYYKGGKCKHCNRFVTASSTGKLRKHPPTDPKKG